MKKLLMALVLTPNMLCAAQWLDPDAGIFWQYTFSGRGDEAYLGNYNDDPTKWLYAAYPLPQGDIEIPRELEGSPVRGIGHYAFNNCSNLTSVTIPLGVVDIRDVAFYNCEKLERVTIPEGMTNIGERAFMNCTNLVSATIPSSVTRVRMETFYNCFGLRTANVSEGVTSIEARAFCACPSLAAVSIPSSVTNIGWMAFSGCDELMKVYVARGDAERIKGMLASSDSGLDLGGLTFAEIVDDGGPYTEVVDGLEWTYTVSDGKAQVGNGLSAAISAATTGAVTVPSSLGGHPVASIGSSAFYYCTGLTSVTIPSSVTSIGDLAFCHCDALSSLSALSNVTRIGEASFSGCSSLSSMKIPAAQYIGDRAFAGCGGIRSVEMRTCVFDGVTSLSTAFPDAYESITDVVLSDESEIVYRREFAGCSALRSVSIPSGVRGIEVEAFAFCGNLSEVNLRPGASRLGYVADRAFQACMELQAMTLPSTVHTIGQYALPSKSFTLYVGKGTVDRVQELLWEAWVDTSKIEFRELNSVYFYMTPKDVGKSARECREVRNGSCIGSLPTVAAEGFEGWWLFDTTYGRYVSEVTAATTADNDVVICGKWVANIYQIDFKGLEGAANTNVTEFTTNDLPLVLGPVEREGWRFLGWMPNGGVIPAGTMSNVTFTAEWEELVEPPEESEVNPWCEDADFSAAVANTYDGYVIDEDYNLLGIVQVKTTKLGVKKGVVTITATATVTDANGKKWSYSKGVMEIESGASLTSGQETASPLVGVVIGLKCTTKGCPVPVFGVTLGKNGMEGAWGEYVIFGARNGMGTKGDEMMAELEHYKGKWSVTVAAAHPEVASYQAGESSTLRLQLNVQAKGEVKIAGNWESGEKVSASAQLVMGDGFAYVPVMVKATKTSPAVNALLRIDAGGEVVLLSATDPARPEVAPYQLEAGGWTVEELDEIEYLPSEVSKGGAAFSARVAVDELAYPAKFAAKKLPAGLKIDAATGVISGTPTKPGHYVAEVTVTSGLNSKVKKTLTVEFDIANYTDDLIPIEDSYGPYYVGVSAVEQIDAAAGCSVSGLPSGLKWTAKDILDSKTKQVKTAANTIYGVPTKACTNTVYFKKSVKELVNGKLKTVTHQASATLRVEGMRPWAIGTFNGGSTNGMVQLTIAKTGKLSGKWMSEGTNWTLSAASFDAFDAERETYHATLIGKSGKASFEVEVEVSEEGLESELFEAWLNEWKTEPWKTLAAQLKGRKVSVPAPAAEDGGTVELTVGGNGTVKAKGTFAGLDGRAYSASCSTVLIPTETEGRYKVYLYFPPKNGKFDGLATAVTVQ